MGQEFLAQEITIVALVGKEQSRLADWYRQPVGNGVVVRILPACQDEAKRASLTVGSPRAKNRFPRGSFESRFR